jgi:hypothetical protein
MEMSNVEPCPFLCTILVNSKHLTPPIMTPPIKNNGTQMPQKGRIKADNVKNINLFFLVIIFNPKNHLFVLV